MGPVTLDPTQMFMVIGGAVSLVTLVWHAGMAAGRVFNRLERVEQRVDDHDDEISEIRDSKRIHPV